MSEFVVLACGSRHYANEKVVYDALDALHAKRAITTLVQGGARGADKLAKEWAKSRGVHCLTFMADWDKYGLAAGPKRNQQMIDEAKPQFVVAFPGNKGTRDMKFKAVAAGIKVWEVQESTTGE